MGPSSISPAILSTQQFDFASTLPPDVPLKSKTAGSVENLEERKLFDQYIAGNFFKQMLAAMRKTTDKPAYFHGGKMEEMILEKFLDPAMAESMAKSSAASFTDPMYKLYKKDWGEA